jgi:hypothetical protein
MFQGPRVRAIRHHKLRNSASFLSELPDLLSELPDLLAELPRYAVENTFCRVAASPSRGGEITRFRMLEDSGARNSESGRESNLCFLC